MPRNLARPDQTTRGLSRNRIAFEVEALYRLLADGDGAAGSGAAAAAAAAPAAGAAAAAPAASAPAAGDGKAAPVVADPKTEAVIAPVVEKPATVDEQRKFLVEKAGLKTEDAAKLTEADLKAQYEAAKAKEGKAPEVKVEDIKIEVPQGIEMSEEQQAEFKAVIADAKLSPTERAQKLLAMHASAVTAAAKAPVDLWVKTQGEWQTAVKADKELGGNNYDAVRSTIAKGISEVGGADAAAIFEAFKFTGAGNNPAIVRVMYRMAKALTEGGPISGGAPAEGKGKDFGARVASMYPSANNGAAKAA